MIENLLLIMAFTLLFVLPLMPGILELINPTDNAPLRIIQEYDHNFRHFADGFRRYVQKHFGEYMADHQEEGVLKDGTRYRFIGENGALSVQNARTDDLIISAHALTLPEGVYFGAEMYCARDVRGGKDAIYRAVLADGDIRLGDNSEVLRWVHSAQRLLVGHGSVLSGRASAERNMMLAAGCRFERLHAPAIFCGAPAAQVEPFPVQELTVVDELPDTLHRSATRRLVDTEVDLDIYTHIVGDIVSYGAIVVGDGSHITGNLKSNRDMRIGRGVTVEGAIVSARDIYIDAGSHVRGPVIAENVIVIASGVEIGSELQLASVSAPYVYLADGVLVHGTIWATEEGYTTDAAEFAEDMRGEMQA